MKIIKKGKIPKPEYEEVCGTCNTDFTYVSKELEHDKEGSYIKCPLCKGFIAHTQ